MNTTKAKVIRTQPSVSIYWLPLVLGAKGFRVTKGKSVGKKDTNR